jgi:hypothetical protein
MAKDALALIDHLEWPQCHVVGVSMGGMIAVEFALLAPERVLSLTLLATHAGSFSGLVPCLEFCGLVQAFLINDVHSKIEHRLLRLYGSKTDPNPEKREVSVGVCPMLIVKDLLKIRYSPFDYGWNRRSSYTRSEFIYYSTS